MSERVGFIGLGIMGRGMAAQSAQGRLCRYASGTVQPAVWTSWSRPGAEAGRKPGRRRRHSDIIVICVSDTPDVERSFWATTA